MTTSSNSFVFMDRSRPKACDGCKARKVRCNGEQTCQQCAHLALKCIYTAPPLSSRSRKSAVRGRVIAMIKSSGAAPALQEPATEQSPLSHVSNERSESPRSILHDALFFAGLAAKYGRVVFPIHPIVTEAEFRSAIEQLDTSRKDCSLVYGLGAMTMNISLLGPRYPESEFDQITSLYSKAIELSGPVMPNEGVSVQSTMISLTASMCLFASHCNIDMALYYLREAIAKVLALGVDNSLTDGEQAQQERLYWLLFIHERFLAIAYDQPITLTPFRNLPRQDPSISIQVQTGFNLIIRLFKIIDSTFISNWQDRQSPSLMFAWIQGKQAELGEGSDQWEDEIKTATYIQQVDLIVTRYWLRTLVWQMALSKYLLAANVDGDKGPMSIFFPMQLSHSVRLLILSAEREAIDAHGTCLLQKIFEVTATTADILVYVSAATENDEQKMAHLNNFAFLHTFLLSMSKFYPVEKSILQEKFETLQRLFPSFWPAQLDP